MNISTISTSIKNLFNGKLSPMPKLPALLLLCTALNRTGTSAYTCSSNAINQFASAADFNSGPNPDGSPNLVNVYTYCLSKSILDNICMNGSIQSVIPANALTITGMGANAGGPVSITATNLLPLVIKGIFG